MKRTISIILTFSLLFPRIGAIPVSAACSHTTYEDYYSYSEYTGNYTASTHEVKTYYERVCENCGEKVDEVYNLEQEEHSMKNGKCKNCDYEESCKHISYEDYYSYSEYTGNYNTSTHEVKAYYERVCENCGEKVDEVYNLEQEAHSMKNGKCKNCDYEESCKHISCEDYYSYSEYTGNYTASTHEVKAYYERVCENCGEKVDEVYNLEQEAHSMKNGKCKNCDYTEYSYEENCEHTSNTPYYSKSEYTGNYNALKHEIKTCYNIVCDNCGETVGETYELEQEEHMYTNGKCDNCGYKICEVCTHENYDDVYTTSKYTGVYTAYNHSVEHNFNRTCTSCEQIIAYVIQTDWGEHKLSKDGKCDCGYIDFSYREKENTDKVEASQKVETKEEQPIQTEETSAITNYSIGVDKSGKYVKVEAEGTSDVDHITVTISGNGYSDIDLAFSNSLSSQLEIPTTDTYQTYNVKIYAYNESFKTIGIVTTTIQGKGNNSVVDTIVEGTKDILATVGGVIVGIVNGGIIQPTMAVSNLIDYFINYKNPEQYEYNKAWRDSLTKKVENFMMSALPYDQYYYYNAGVAGGEISEFCVGAVIVVRGLVGAITKVETVGDGVQMAKVILDNGDEAVVVAGENVDDIVVLTASNLDDMAIAAQKSLENIDDVVKAADDLFDYQKLAKTIAESYADKLKPTQLVEELANCGEKVSMEKVVAVMKDTNGKLVWLEQGKAETAGLWHILKKHAKQFLDNGISVKDIPDFVTDVIKNGTVVKELPQKGARIYKVIFGNGEEGLLNVVIGSNGFIVTAYPVT